MNIKMSMLIEHIIQLRYAIKELTRLEDISGFLRSFVEDSVLKYMRDIGHFFEIISISHSNS